MIRKQAVVTLKSLYDLMEKTRSVRASIVNRMLSLKPCEQKQIHDLKNALASLKQCSQADCKANLAIEGSTRIRVDLFYEINELEKDIFYLEHGEARFLSYLESLHLDFSSHVQAALKQLTGKRFNCFITDRDGTINNYCGRYGTSIQSVYNALFLTRFARNNAANPIIITSAPLKNPGIVDVSTLPERTVIYAASKGREFIDLSGTRRSYPIDTEKQQLINRLNQRLTDLVADKAYEKFSLIGSGLQQKFGQTTIARQDISGSISKERSQTFLEVIERIVQELDPSGENFIIEDTGLDIEIILTVAGGDTGLKDFDKKEAIKFLDRELSLVMENGPHLVCGDTSSDLPMLEASMEKSIDTWSVFVTKDPQLVEKTRDVCPNAVTVPEPDMLITILNQLAKIQA
jgi:hypothetical protein